MRGIGYSWRVTILHLPVCGSYITENAPKIYVRREKHFDSRRRRLELSLQRMLWEDSVEMHARSAVLMGVIFPQLLFSFQCLGVLAH